MTSRDPGGEHQACAGQALIARAERLLADLPERLAPMLAATSDEALVRALVESEIRTVLLLLACQEDALGARRALLGRLHEG